MSLMTHRQLGSSVYANFSNWMQTRYLQLLQKYMWVLIESVVGMCL